MASSTHNIPLTDLLAATLPKSIPFTFYHVSTPPLKHPAIFSAPPGRKPERTYCESHFLNVSIVSNEAEQLVFAIEILIYTTKHLTTLFVSKADSTGYISDLGIPRTQTSPLRTIATTFVSYLARHKQRPGKRLVVSLFARAANQYLYPGSVENGKKHVSDDRQLIKWWCRVLDPVLRSYTPEDAQEQGEKMTAQAYLTVPGDDGIAHFLPPAVRADPTLRKRWKNGHPLRELSATPNGPPRCLIPHFPDDPKARFLDELDDEIPDVKSKEVDGGSPSKRGGQWKSVRSLEQFWEMMAFRQECSSGRLVGFVWVVVTPPDVQAPVPSTPRKRKIAAELNVGGLSASSFSPPLWPKDPAEANRPRPIRQSSPRSERPPSGPIIPRLPRIKKIRSALSQPAETKYYLWPADSRGEIVLDEREYKRANELLLRLDFANPTIAASSTKRWIEEVGVLGGVGRTWGKKVIGRQEAAPEMVLTNGSVNGNGVNTLNIVKTKRKADGEAPSADSPADGAANVLSAGLVRKKAKVVPEPVPTPPAAAAENGVNVLGVGLVRKKAKP